jgi:acyl-CoA synthetase (AMP-forming)/AMP-acid ligase II
LRKYSLDKKLAPADFFNLFSDIATINYTSGTTGDPKGVVLTHKNICTVTCGITIFSLNKPWTKDDVWFSYLPMAHIFERGVHCTIMIAGGSWYFGTGNIKTLLQEIKAVRPTIFGSVPRVMNRIYEKVQNQMKDSRAKNFVLSRATKAKRKKLDKGTVESFSIWNRALKKARRGLGGRVHTWVCGAAPIDPNVKGFVKELFGCYIVEAYGYIFYLDYARKINNVLGKPKTSAAAQALPSSITKKKTAPWARLNRGMSFVLLTCLTWIIMQKKERERSVSAATTSCKVSSLISVKYALNYLSRLLQRASEDCGNYRQGRLAAYWRYWNVA